MHEHKNGIYELSKGKNAMTCTTNDCGYRANVPLSKIRGDRNTQTMELDAQTMYKRLTLQIGSYREIGGWWLYSLSAPFLQNLLADGWTNDWSEHDNVHKWLALKIGSYLEIGANHVPSPPVKKTGNERCKNAHKRFENMFVSRDLMAAVSLAPISRLELGLSGIKRTHISR